MTQLLTVAQVAHELQLHPDTIRRWEKKGLIKSHRDANNHRVFAIDEVNRVHMQQQQPHEAHFSVLHADSPSAFQSIELFAGAGGLALGFENAGLQHSLLVELDKHAAATLSLNRPDWPIVHADVRNVDYANTAADVVTGGFPCQAFSYAGHRMGFEDTRGTLFFEFARCVAQTQPKIIVGENVRGLLNHDGGKTLKVMLDVLDELGYDTAYRVLRAQYFDVAQKRERLVIIGLRRDFAGDFIFPKEQAYIVPLRTALKDVPASDGAKYTEKKFAVMHKIPEGGYWRDLSDAEQRDYMGASYFHGGGKTGMARRLAWNEPSLTLTCNPAQKQTERCHPSETRPLTVREYARIQSFPDLWQFSGSTNVQYKQIGNAVPVNLAYHIARCVRAMLEGRFDGESMVAVGRREDETYNTSCK
ncbi:MAG: DNA (cytosine-5-)-methyltransferase [Formosimonas sp.]